MNWPWAKPKSLGAQGEDLAARALRRERYKILHRNLVLGRYEIDIVARDGDTVAFVEVKTRRSDHVLAPTANITYQKKQHIIRAARQYMSQHFEPETYYRFDVVSVVLPEAGKPRIEIIRSAFREE